jgi:hypothetical protein
VSELTKIGRPTYFCERVNFGHRPTDLLLWPFSFAGGSFQNRIFQVIFEIDSSEREIEKFIIRQPPIGEKDDYDSETRWGFSYWCSERVPVHRGTGAHLFPYVPFLFPCSRKTASIYRRGLGFVREERAYSV